MEVQFDFVSKEKAKELIDSMPGNRVMMLSFNKKTGISAPGKYIKKGKGKRMADKAETILLTTSYPIIKLDLHQGFISNIERADIIKSIMLADLLYKKKKVEI